MPHLTSSPAAYCSFCLGGQEEILKVWHTSKTYKTRGIILNGTLEKLNSINVVLMPFIWSGWSGRPGGCGEVQSCTNDPHCFVLC